MDNNGTNQLLLSSYIWLRRLMGVLGLALPVVLVMWGLVLSGSVLNSISDYYSLRTRDAFVGILFAIAWFLAAYKGYDRIDDIAGKIAGVFALGVAFIPNSAGGWQTTLHFTFAAGLFLTLSFFCLFLFTKTAEAPGNDLRHTITSFRFGVIKSDEPRLRLKKRRNKVYVACGLIMLLCIVLTALYNWLGKNTSVSAIRPVLALEWLMIWAFGFSWLVKGETLWSDEKPRK